jgi:aspartyl-tRNA(Asn)/glutamyl-tRNA(Gln) amidotransferase subunit C
MKLSCRQVEHIAWLARLALSQDEIENFSFQLSNILENFDILQQVDTTNIPPTTQTNPLQNVLREDVATESFRRNEVLANAPEQEEDCFKVKAILE